MPEITGLELLRRLRDQKIDWPVIVMTGQGDVTLAVELIKAGALDFIEKPYHHEELLGAVRSAVMDSSDAREEEKAEVRKRLAGLSPLKDRSSPRLRPDAEFGYRGRVGNQSAHGRSPSCQHFDQMQPKLISSGSHDDVGAMRSR